MGVLVVVAVAVEMKEGLWEGVGELDAQSKDEVVVGVVAAGGDDAASLVILASHCMCVFMML